MQSNQKIQFIVDRKSQLITPLPYSHVELPGDALNKRDDKKVRTRRGGRGGGRTRTSIGDKEF